MEALAIPVKLYIHYNANTFSPDKYIVATCDMSRTFPDQYVLLETRDISIDVNQPEPFDIIAVAWSEREDSNAGKRSDSPG